MSLSSPNIPPHQHISQFNSVSRTTYSPVSTPFSFYLDINAPSHFAPTSLIPASKVSPPQLITTLMTNGIRHPKFQRRTQTEYIMTTTEPVRHAILHVGQIANYLAFDKALRNGRRVSDLPGLPIGYIEFAHVFNTGATSKDHR